MVALAIVDSQWLNRSLPGRRDCGEFGSGAMEALSVNAPHIEELQQHNNLRFIIMLNTPIILRQPGQFSL